LRYLPFILSAGSENAEPSYRKIIEGPCGPSIKGSNFSKLEVFVETHFPSQAHLLGSYATLEEDGQFFCFRIIERRMNKDTALLGRLRFIGPNANSAARP
jgi:hypothetical protein